MAIQSAIPARSLLGKQENGPRIRLRLPAILGIYGKSSEKGDYCIPLRSYLVSCCEVLGVSNPVLKHCHSWRTSSASILDTLQNKVQISVSV